jgi:DNA sulfur modification protein DndD
VIIEELVLHDFGIYRGRNVIDLNPVSPDKPIVLIGARNGRGKTTLLDSVNLAFFGQRARLSNRGQMPWEDYLRRSIHRRAGSGAAVSLRFSVADDFETKVYEISRSWQVAGKTIKESFDVVVNGRPDKLLAEDWNEHIEALLPVEVASLNFFDGEKIDELADPMQSRNVLRSAVTGLLGLGVLEKLDADLKVYLRRKMDEAIGSSVSQELLDLEAEGSRLSERRSALAFEMAQARTALDRSKEILRRVEERASRLGTDKWEKRVELELKLSELQEEKTSYETRLQNLAAGIAPLSLTTDLIERTVQQAATDENVRIDQQFAGLLAERDELILKQLSPESASELKTILEVDRDQRKLFASRAVVHQSGQVIGQFMSGVLEEISETQEIQDLLELIDRADYEMAHLNRLLTSVPAEDQLLPILAELTTVRGQVNHSQKLFDELSEEMHQVSTTTDRIEQRADRLRQEEADNQKQILEERRAREYAIRARETIESVSRLTVARNLSLIEGAILRRFRELIGKNDLITSVRIDQETLELSVTSSDGTGLSIDQLSAGERQLLATAVLWGLSTVAGRSIPLIIDTPLGRLDGIHRIKLAEKYFPSAAHQVIILSTDSEFTGELRSIISDSTSREYLIEFDEHEDSSRIKLGYFEELESAN